MAGRREMIAMAGAVLACFVGETPAGAATGEECTAWVGEVMERMMGVRPGMMRSELLRVFREQGGLSTRTQRTFASRDCAYFQVDVEFVEGAGWPRDGAGRVVGVEEGTDVIRTVSRPYLQWQIFD